MNEQSDDLGLQLQAFSKLEPSQSAMNSAIERVQRTIQERRVNLQHRPYPLTRERPSWLPRVAVYVAGLLALGALAPWIASFYVSSSVVFADTVAEMRSARSVCFDALVSAPGAPDQKMKTSIFGPHLRRDETPEGTIAINDAQQGKWLMLDPKQKTAHFVTSRPWAQADLYEETLQVDPSKAKQLPVKDVDGHRCVGFEFRTVQKDLVSTRTVWINEETKLPVRIEKVYTSDTPYLNARQVLTNFVFDAPIEESNFSLTPPDDYKLQSTNDGEAWTEAEPPSDETGDE